MSARCSLIFPVWVQAGWVKWAGPGPREPLFTTERRRCQGVALPPLARDGLTYRLCREHAAEFVARKLFHFDTRKDGAP